MSTTKAAGSSMLRAAGSENVEQQKKAPEIPIKKLEYLSSSNKTLEMTTDFDQDFFETRLETLKDTQDAIVKMSEWCQRQRKHHKKIVASWLNVFKRVRVEQRLILFYVANDVIQNSRRNKLEFAESWPTALQKATTMVRDEKVKNKILRIFGIWQKRGIYGEDFISDLKGLLNIKAPSKNLPTESEDYQPAKLKENILNIVELAKATDKSFHKLPVAPCTDFDEIRIQLKEKSNADHVLHQFERYITYMSAYMKNVNTEIDTRKELINNIEDANKFYTEQRAEVKVVVTAYKSFGNRIKTVKKKLEELANTLPSPMPSPDINAPSPERDADLQLPDEQQTNISTTFLQHPLNGYVSYMDGKLPFDINDFRREIKSNPQQQPIEVIGSRSDDEGTTPNSDFYKSDSISGYSDDNISIPGLNSEYTSLARSAQQYGNMMAPPNPPLFGNANLKDSYNTLMSSYNPVDNIYQQPPTPVSAPRVINRPQQQQQPLMPPPPPPAALTAANDVAGNAWWSNMHGRGNNSAVAAAGVYNENLLQNSTAHSANNTYNEHDALALGLGTQDIDLRPTHHLPAFGGMMSAKLPLSKEKTRQLDIDHRNLISLTGSPSNNNDDSLTWLANKNKFQDLPSEDMDYRNLDQRINKLVEAAATEENKKSPVSMPPPPPAAASPLPVKKDTSPSKTNASSTTEAQSNDVVTDASVAQYDPAEMVIDMDMSMSDDDIEDLCKVADSAGATEIVPLENLANLANLLGSPMEEIPTTTSSNVATPRPPLLETPTTADSVDINHDYDNQELWDANAYNSTQPQQQQQWQEMPPMPWNNNAAHPMGVPPPPRPPMPPQFMYAGAPPGTEYSPRNAAPMRGRGAARGWYSTNPFRNFNRGAPYSPRGGGGPPRHPNGHSPNMRGGNFRGKFRAPMPWT